MYNFTLVKKTITYLFLLVLISACKEDIKVPEIAAPTIEKPKPTFLFNYNLDEYDVVTDTIKSGDSFGKILFENRVGYPKIDEIARTIKETFDVRKINIGKPYTILKSKDSGFGCLVPQHTTGVCR